MSDLFISTLVGLSFLLLLSIYILAIVDVHKRTFKTLSERGHWLALIWILPILGSAYYLLQGRKNGIRK
jgi:hypothetical protein